MTVSPPRPGPAVVPRRTLRRRGVVSAPSDPDSRSSLRREYVSGGGGRGRYNPQFTNGRTVLPHPFDDLTNDFGNDVYADMLLDSQVAACLIVLKASILEDGVVLSPAVTDQADPRHDEACEIRDMAARMLGQLDTPLDDVLWTMLDGLAYGNKIAELVYQVQSVTLPPEPTPPEPPVALQAPPGTPPLPGQPALAMPIQEPTPPPPEVRLLLNLVKIKPKPRQHVAFVVDPYLNVLGVVGVKPGAFGQVVPQTVTPTSSEAQVLPRSKFAIFSFRPEDGDPRGTSVLRPAYEPWWRKRSITQEYMAYLAQFAGPSLWATTAEGVQTEPLTDAIGNPLPDTPETPEADTPSPEALLRDALMDFRGGTVLVVPYGTELHTIEMSGAGEPFLAGLAQVDQQITKAILTQTLATEEGQHQARAAATVHQDVLDTLVRQGKRAVIRMLSFDILRPWVLLNYGVRAADELVPVPSLGTTEQRDLAGLMTAVAALKSADYYAPMHLPAVDEQLGLPVRDMASALAVPLATLAPPEPPPARVSDDADDEPADEEENEEESSERR